jgi:hypothetical protein
MARPLRTGEAVGRPLRILHCPWNLGGNAAQLARAERALGLDSRLVTLGPDTFGFAADETLTTKRSSLPARELARYRLLWRALRWADVVHFNFGQTLLMPQLAPDIHGGFRHSPRRGLWHVYARLIFMKDLPLLHAAGKRLFVTFQGDDIRFGAICDRLREWGLEPDYYSADGDVWKQRILAQFVRYAAGIYTINIDHLPHLPRSARFLPYTVLDPSEVPVEPLPPRRVPLIAHAPTHRGIKGTRHLVAAVERLRAEGMEIDLDLIEGLPHEVASTRYRRADLIVDQLLLGWYGGLGVEVMAMGKPLVVHVDERDAQRALPPEMFAELPVIRADPWTIVGALRVWLGERRRELATVGMRSRRYVERWHDPRRIARVVAADYHQAVGRPLPPYDGIPAALPRAEAPTGTGSCCVSICDPS